jgi:hypothetical protein
MKRVGLLFLTLLLNVIIVRPVSAAPAGALVITEVMTASAASVSSEFVELHNPTSESIDVTGWKIQYISATGTTTYNRVTLDGSLASKGFLLAATEGFQIEQSIISDATMTGTGFATSSGRIRLVDQNNVVVDALSYGLSALQSEGVPAESLAAGQSLKRVTNEDAQFLDTNSNADDFVISNEPFAQGGGLEDVEELLDVCPNIEDIQPSLPVGYEIISGECVEIQPDVPSLHNMTLHITELLADAVGSDVGNEYIELYNPHDQPVGLAGYVLFVGPNYEKSYTLPDTLEISPNQYLALYNSTLNFTLVNSTSRAKLVAPGGDTVSETAIYNDPEEGYSWAYFDDGWMMTQKTTPDAENEYLWVVDAPATESSSLAPCAPGKYRNPETNRCRAISSASSSLAPCAPDQVRNPETNRCRKISATTSSLTPCQPGQERNPETNRCRKIVSNSKTTAPCQHGYERNPETNRCRKVVAANSSLGAPAAINPISLNERVIVLLVIMAGGYALFEYRNDISQFISRLRNKRGDPRPPG